VIGGSRITGRSLLRTHTSSLASRLRFAELSGFSEDQTMVGVRRKAALRQLALQERNSSWQYFSHLASFLFGRTITPNDDTKGAHARRCDELQDLAGDTFE